MNINLQIEELALVVLESHQQPMLNTSLERKPTRFLGQNGVASGLQKGGTVNAMRTDSITIGGSSNNEPSNIAQQIAWSVYGGINQ